MFRPLKRPFGYVPAARKTAPSRPQLRISSPSSSDGKSDGSLEEQEVQPDSAVDDHVEQERDLSPPKPPAKRARRNTYDTYRSVVRGEAAKSTYNTRSKSKKSKLISSSTSTPSGVRKTRASLSGDDSSTSNATSPSEDLDLEDDGELATSFGSVHDKKETKKRGDGELRKDMVRAKRVLQRNGKMEDMPEILKDIFDSL